MEVNKIAIGSDHAGFPLKEHLKKALEEKGFTVLDRGSYSEERTDYPDHAHSVARDIEEGEADLGLIMCGSGNGINMAANKHPGVRSALCWNEDIVRLARAHNDANVMALPGRFIDPENAVRLVDVFLATEFEGGRHEKRVEKIPC